MHELFVESVTALVPPSPANMEEVAEAMERLTPVILDWQVGEQVLSWGRYLLHADPAGRFNVQLDVFSSGYQGGIHAHGTYGIFWVLRGGLRFWNYADGSTAPGPLLSPGRQTALQLVDAGRVGPGGAACFCPPHSDWHRVSAFEGEVQTVSVHLYGPAFDLEVGAALDAQACVRTYTRGPLLSRDALAGRLWYGR